jgi:hypothetical protein
MALEDKVSKPYQLSEPMKLRIDQLLQRARAKEQEFAREQAALREFVQYVAAELNVPSEPQYVLANDLSAFVRPPEPTPSGEAGPVQVAETPAQ